jgi:hypothetical protein
MTASKLLMGTVGSDVQRPLTHMFYNRRVSGQGTNDQHYFYRLDNNGNTFTYLTSFRQWTGYDDIQGLASQYNPRTQKLVILEHGLILATPPSTNHTYRYLKSVYDVSSADSPSLITKGTQNISGSRSTSGINTKFSVDGYFYTLSPTSSSSGEQLTKISEDLTLQQYTIADDVYGDGNVDYLRNAYLDDDAGLVIGDGVVPFGSFGTTYEHGLIVPESDYRTDALFGHVPQTSPVEDRYGHVVGIDEDRSLIFTTDFYKRDGTASTYYNVFMCFSYSDPTNVTFQSEVVASGRANPPSPSATQVYDKALQRLVVFSEEESGSGLNPPVYTINTSNPASLSITQETRMSYDIALPEERVVYDPVTKVGYFHGKAPFGASSGEIHKFTLSSSGISITHDVGSGSSDTSANVVSDDGHIQCMYG